MYEIVLE